MLAGGPLGDVIRECLDGDNVRFSSGLPFRGCELTRSSIIFSSSSSELLLLESLLELTVSCLLVGGRVLS